MNGRYDFLMKRILGAGFADNLGWSSLRISRVAHFGGSTACQGKGELVVEHLRRCSYRQSVGNFRLCGSLGMLVVALFRRWLGGNMLDGLGREGR